MLRTCLCHHGRGLLDRGQDSRIGPTAAQMPVHRRADLILGRILRRRKAGRQPGSSSRSGSNRNAAPEHRSTPAATDATPAQQQSYHAPPPTKQASPSSVVMLFPLTAATGVTHERISFPSSNTEHAPHCARPQPKRGPCRWSSLCNTYRSGVSRLALTPCVSPFTLIFRLLAIPSS